MTRLLLVGPDRWAQGFARAANATGAMVVARAQPPLVPSPSWDDHDVILVGGLGPAGLESLTPALLAAGRPVACLRETIGPDFERFLVACEQAHIPLMLAHPSLYLPAFRLLVHSLATGIAGRLQRLVLTTSEWPFSPMPPSRSALQTGAVDLPQLAMLAPGPVGWAECPDGRSNCFSGDGNGVEVRVERCAAGTPCSLSAQGEDSRLLLACQAGEVRLTAERGGTERLLAANSLSDPLCGLTKALRLLIDGRTRTLYGGHSALRYLQFRESLKRAASRQKRRQQRQGGGRPSPHLYDLCLKLPPAVGDTAVPFIEAKFNVEGKCNQRCLFCFSTRGSMALLGLDKAPSVLRRLRRDGVAGVVFSGREPTLNPDLPRLIALARSLGMSHVAIETNAVACRDRELVQACRQAGLDHAFVSFHSANAETMERLTGVAGSFPALLAGLGNLLAAGVSVELNCVVNRANLGELDELVDFVADSYPQISALTFSFLAPLGLAEGRDDLVPRISEAAPALRGALLRAEAAGLRPQVPGRCGIPPCQLPGLERFFVEWRQPAQLPDSEQPLADRVKLPECRLCRFDHCCHGLWRNYAELYGTEEIRQGRERLAFAVGP